MVELVTFLTGSVFLFFGLKILLMKVFIDTIKAIVLHKYTLTIILAVILGMIFMPDIISPYLDLFLKYFTNGIKSILDFIWGIITQMFDSII